MSKKTFLEIGMLLLILVLSTILNVPIVKPNLEQLLTERMIDIYGGADNAGYGSFPNPFPIPCDGRGWHNPMDLVTPKSKVILFAEVTYNAWPVQNNNVTFILEGPQGYSIIMYAVTNEIGVANVVFEMPWPDENPESLLGCWNATATATIGGVTVADSMLFIIHI